MWFSKLLLVYCKPVLDKHICSYLEQVTNEVKISLDWAAWEKGTIVNDQSVGRYRLNFMLIMNKTYLKSLPGEWVEFCWSDDGTTRQFCHSLFSLEDLPDHKLLKWMCSA